jgi:membrane fusion protein, multidrug efflux system
MKVKKIILWTICFASLVGCSHKQKADTTEVIPVKTLTAASTVEAGDRSYVGTVEESYGSMLSFSVMGTVSQVLVDEGQAVRKGQPLAVLDKSTMLNAYDISKSSLKQAQDAYRRMNALYKKGSLPEIKFIEVQTRLSEAEAAERIARKNVKDCVLCAPFSGYISKRIVDIGNNVVPGIGCFKLVKVDEVKIDVSIPEQEISKIHIGQNISFTVAALDGRRFVGRVKEKGVQANPFSHTYEVKLILPNPGQILLPGMVCSANINTKINNSVMIIPQESVMLDGDDKFVWIANGGSAQKRPVTVGGVNNQGVIIISGLESGDEVIIDGQNKVSEGSKIKVL